MNTSLVQRGFVNALGTCAYIAVLVFVMTHVVAKFSGPDTIAAPMAFLTLFVLSAAVTGGLVLGKPILMYLDNKKKEAVELFFYTVGWLFVATVVLLVVNALV